MKYSSEILWYLFWILSIVGSFFATLFAIRHFENANTRKDQAEKENG